MRRAILFTAILAATCHFSCGSIKPSLCATGEQWEQGKGCVCKPGHVKDDDGKGCHRETPTTTTTTTTSTTTTTTTSTTLKPATPVPPTPPPIAPSPTPTCIPEQPMPSGPVDVRGGLKPSSCTEPGENRRCFRDGAGASGVLWEADERACWPVWAVAEQGRSPKVLGGIALMCEPGYLSDPDDTSRGCFDAWGRRYKWDGGAWREQTLSDRFSGWWLGICPPRAPKTCAAPTPTKPGENPAGCYAGPWRMECRFESCDIKGEPGGSAFERPVAEVARRLFGEVEREVPNETLTEHGNRLANALRAEGFCVATHEDRAARVSDDEIAVWSPSNPRKEHLDFGRATGATPGFSVLLQRPFMVARGHP